MSRTRFAIAIITVLLGLISVLLSIATNIATSALPEAGGHIRGSLGQRSFS